MSQPMPILQKLRYEHHTEESVAKALGSMRNILNAVSEYLKINISDILGDSRVSKITHARREAIKLMRLAGFSTQQIGNKLCKCHTTIVYHLRVLGMTKAQQKHKGE